MKKVISIICITLLVALYSSVTPGTEFGKQYSDFIRMNFSQDHDRAVDAVKRICEMVDRYRV